MKIEQLRRHAMAMPMVTEEPHHQFSSFRVQGKIFATVPPDAQHVHLFVDEADREQALTLYPQFIEKLLWGGKVVGLRIALAQADASIVESLVLKAWTRKAPRSKVPLGKVPLGKAPGGQAPPGKMPSVASGYSGTPLARKLGLKAGCRLLAIGAPPAYPELLSPMPDGVSFQRRLTATTDIVHWFVTDRSELARRLGSLNRSLPPDAALWVSWPKKSSAVPTTVTEDTIRELALPLGLVDVKVCAVSEVWSGLKLVRRKELR